ncbi:hypothetical protein NEHOM01_1822 [Nematocida homosporus]|uniref:uncharacterized protein n=1 Tax=Nematocida homosporus TaxID=1912981 RepID=UPI00221EA1E9|nr:uncharacterized protein NEHOM01_1822 [Nematocida homosporus]KAI5186956.1 hypothetical protein NEHOM01_1822 [Nematocida homosporus]
MYFGKIWFYLMAAIAMIVLSGVSIVHSQGMRRFVPEILWAHESIKYTEEAQSKEDASDQSDDGDVCPHSILSPTFKECLLSAVAGPVVDMELHKLAKVMDTCGFYWENDETGMDPLIEVYDVMEELVAEHSKKLRYIHSQLKDEIETLRFAFTSDIKTKRQAISELKKLRLFKVVENDGKFQNLKFQDQFLSPIFVKELDIAKCGNMVLTTYKQLFTDDDKRIIDTLFSSDPGDQIVVNTSTMNKMVWFFYEFYTFQMLVVNTWHKSYNARFAPEFTAEQEKMAKDLFDLTPLQFLASHGGKSGTDVINKLISPAGLSLFYKNWQKRHVSTVERGLEALSFLKGPNSPMTKNEQERLYEVFLATEAILFMMQKGIETMSVKLAIFSNEIESRRKAATEESRLPFESLEECLGVADSSIRYNWQYHLPPKAQ